MELSGFRRLNDWSRDLIEIPRLMIGLTFILSFCQFVRSWWDWSDSSWMMTRAHGRGITKRVSGWPWPVIGTNCDHGNCHCWPPECHVPGPWGRPVIDQSTLRRLHREEPYFWFLVESIFSLLFIYLNIELYKKFNYPKLKCYDNRLSKSMEMERFT